MRKAFFRKYFLLLNLHFWAKKCKFSNKNDNFSAWRDFNKIFCDVCTYIKWNFKPQISPIFHIEYVNHVWISGVLGVNRQYSNIVSASFGKLENQALKAYWPNTVNFCHFSCRFTWALCSVYVSQCQYNQSRGCCDRNGGIGRKGWKRYTYFAGFNIKDFLTFPACF